MSKVTGLGKLHLKTLNNNPFVSRSLLDQHRFGDGGREIGSPHSFMKMNITTLLRCGLLEATVCSYALKHLMRNTFLEHIGNVPCIDAVFPKPAT